MKQFCKVLQVRQANIYYIFFYFYFRCKHIVEWRCSDQGVKSYPTHCSKMTFQKKPLSLNLKGLGKKIRADQNTSQLVDSQDIQKVPSHCVTGFKALQRRRDLQAAKCIQFDQGMAFLLLDGSMSRYTITSVFVGAASAGTITSADLVFLLFGVCLHNLAITSWLTVTTAVEHIRAKHPWPLLFYVFIQLCLCFKYFSVTAP